MFTEPKNRKHFNVIHEPQNMIKKMRQPYTKKNCVFMTGEIDVTFKTFIFILRNTKMGLTIETFCCL